MSPPAAAGGDPGESESISRRRELLEEVLRERSKAVAVTPADEDDPDPESWRWRAGMLALMTDVPRDLKVRRRIALEVAVVALAWLERIDVELRGPGASPPA